MRCKVVQELICCRLCFFLRCLRSSVISLASIRSLSADEICGIGELCRKNSKVSTMRSLAFDVMYKFDICNDELLGPMSSLAGHEGPKLAFVNFFHVQCTLVGQTLCCCNQPGHENELPLRVVGAVLMCAVRSMLFRLEAEGDPKGA
jgi:hypothetical protein